MRPGVASQLARKWHLPTSHPITKSAGCGRTRVMGFDFEYEHQERYQN